LSLVHFESDELHLHAWLEAPLGILAVVPCMAFLAAVPCMAYNLDHVEDVPESEGLVHEI